MERLWATFCLALAVAVASPAAAAPPDPPERMSYQGILLDDQGQPRTGTVDLTLRIYDALVGGTKLYVETQLGVVLTDGVFSIELGPTGAATDPPTDPVTTSFADALAGDLAGTGPDRYLEVTVGSTGALSRSQILTVPYAFRADEAGHAETADLATTATTATTATDATSVGGLSSSFVTEIFEHTNLDGTGPSNADPTEGLGDTDLDGIANFVDPDNDDDGLTDGQEVAQGSDINVVTPIVTAAVPDSGDANLTHAVTVQGSNFEPGLTVVFGSETPTPSNVTSTSFDVSVGPQAAGPADIQVTIPNGQSGTLTNAFNFLVNLFHGIQRLNGYFSFDVTGTEVLAIGGGQNFYSANGIIHNFPTKNSSGPGAEGHLAVAFDPSGAVVGLRCRATGSTCNVEYAVDSDADFALGDETGVVIDAPTANNPRIRAPSIAFDPSGRPVLGYHANDAALGFVSYVAHDRDGNGDFLGTNERVAIDIAAGTQQDDGEVAVDSAARPAYAYYVSNQNAIRVAWDRSGDGDYDDTVGGNPEVSSVVTGTSDPGCLGLAFAPDDDLVLVYDVGAGLVFMRDNDADGDFTGAGETVVLDATADGVCDVSAGDGNDVSVAYIAGDDTIRVLVDRDDDGDFDGPTENVALSSNGLGIAYLRVAHNDAGKALVATSGPNVDDRVVLSDPTP